MTARPRMALALLALALSACLFAAPVEAQTASPQTAGDQAEEAARSAMPDDEEGFWEGIVSSFVDFFGGDSGEAGAEEEPGGNPDKPAQVESGTAADGDARNPGPEEARKPGAAAVSTEIVSRQPNRRRSPQHSEAGGGDIAPGHVHRATADLVSEIDILRKAMNVDGSPDKAPVLEHRSQVHVYAKSLEVMEKTARLQRRLGMIPADVGHMPVGPVSRDDLHRGVRAIIEELRRVKRQMVVNEEIEPAPLADGKTSSLVYRNLAHASLLLDGLVGRPTSANDLYRHMLRIHHEMLLVAAELGVSLDLDPPAVEGGKETVAVAQQVVRAANKVINLQSSLGMDASRPPRFALEEVTPADVFDATNFLLAELVRIKAHLDVRLPGNGPLEARNKTTADVFARVLLVIRNLDIMSNAAEGAG